MTQSPPQSFRGAESHSLRHRFSDTHRHIHTESQTDSPPLPPAREGDPFSTLPFPLRLGPPHLTPLRWLGDPFPLALPGTPCRPSASPLRLAASPPNRFCSCPLPFSPGTHERWGWAYSQEHGNAPRPHPTPRPSVPVPSDPHCSLFCPSSWPLAHGAGD